MDEKRKTAYVAAGIFLFIGLVVLSVAFDQEKVDKTIAIFGFFLTGLGGLGLWKPEVGEVIAHWMENAGKGSRTTQNQKSANARHSPHAFTNQGNVTIHQSYHYGSKNKRGKRE